MEAGSILAIDLARQTGLACGRPGEIPLLQSVDFMGDGDLHDFYGNLTAWMATRLRDNPPDLIAIEEPVPPSALAGRTNDDTTMMTIGGFAIVIGIIKAKKIPYEPVRVGTWRKHFIGRASMKAQGMSTAEVRRQNKAAVMRRCKLLGWSPPDDNAGDAAGIWDWAGATTVRALPHKLHLFGEQTRGSENAKL
jgi:hypothetical protein